MVQRFVSLPVLKAFDMFYNFLLLIHRPSQVWLIQDLDLFLPQVNLILGLFDVENLLQYVFKLVKINSFFDITWPSDSFLPKYLLQIILTYRDVKVTT